MIISDTDRCCEAACILLHLHGMSSDLDFFRPCQGKRLWMLWQVSFLIRQCCRIVSVYPGHHPVTGGLVCFGVVLLMEDIYHVEINVRELMENLEMLVVYPIVLQGFIHPRWLFGISSINSINTCWKWGTAAICLSAARSFYPHNKKHKTTTATANWL